ncbi:hypothetical protein [Asticcacaulis sp. EMRT-3]|uniref:hypothetical protein n=1 Tax=Asticcacaulis sp. EMRT-3 TaxID=3040349 RepID=UPI0024AF71ED|nr:hypothetical protein [Asticcacaulis sp. EMRT-3]MDI7775384.1 hypothetical protein [Asticcacaulis sp. EMRT-3]
MRPLQISAVSTPAGVYALSETETAFGGRTRSLSLVATVWGDFQPDKPALQAPGDGDPYVAQTADFLCRSVEGLSLGGWLSVRGADWQITSLDEDATGTVRLRLERLHS